MQTATPATPSTAKSIAAPEPLPAAEKHIEHTCAPTAHKRLEHLICEHSAEVVPHGYREKLERIAAGKNSSLHIARYLRSQDHIKVCAHKRQRYPAEHRTDTPYPRRFSERKQEILCAHRKQQRQPYHLYTVFGLGRYHNEYAANKRCDAAGRIDQPEHPVSARFPRYDKSREGQNDTLMPRGLCQTGTVSGTAPLGCS